MEQTEIQLIISETVAQLKKGVNKKERPRFNPVYIKTVDLKERIEVHTDLDNVPKGMIKRRGPYEDDKQYEYRKNNWNNITMPYFMKALGSLNRIMNPSNYSITFDSNQTEEQEYFNKYIPVFGSIENYFEQVVLTQKIVDPNSLMVIKPASLPIREEVVDGEQVFVFDDTKKIAPVPFIYGCEKVIHCREGVYAMIEIEEKSWVKNGNMTVKEGKIFEFYDTENIYRIKQVGVKREYEFTAPELYYPHNLGYLPCERLKGIPKKDEDLIYYQSYFIYAIPHLDVALFEYSNLDMSTVTQLFPQRVEYVDKCEYAGCDHGIIRMWDEENESEIHNNCPSCHGSGVRQKVGPMMTKQHIAPDRLTSDQDTQMPFPGLAYVAPDSAPLTFVHNKFKQDVIDAFSFVNINVSNTDVKGSETALGKQIDREELFSFIMRISNEFYDLMGFCIKTIGMMRYGREFKMPIISPPTSFAIRSEQDLTAELIEGKKAGLPDIALRQIIRDLIAKRFSNQVNIEPIVSVVFLVDRFVTSNTIDLTAKLANGTAMKWEAVLHDSIYTIIDNALLTDPNFFTKDIMAQKDYIIAESKKIAAEIHTANTATVKVEDIA